MINWSPQQDLAIKAVREWLKDPNGPQIFRLFGFAGTGKTTLAKELAASVSGMALAATFTGKASLVLRSKGFEGASTIHSLIYSVEVDPETGIAEFKLNIESALADADLLIVDEVSMVDDKLAADLMSYGKRILVLGDPEQLPPIKGTGFFINSEPDFMLTEVHRQAADNPIIRMSMDIREGKRLQAGQYGESIIMHKLRSNRDERTRLVGEADQVLCGMNRSRVDFNRRIRELKGLIDPNDPWRPVAGDRLICLRNKHDEALFNGALWECEELTEHQRKYGDPFWKIKVSSLDEDRDMQMIRTLPEFFNGRDKDMSWKQKRGYHEFTHGWAITTHKAQGSQWPHVAIFDESGVFGEDARKWIYTALTRASDKVSIFL